MLLSIQRPSMSIEKVGAKWWLRLIDYFTLTKPFHESWEKNQKDDHRK